MRGTDRTLVLTDLLLGAVWADGVLTDDEQGTMRRALAELLGAEPERLPEAVEARIAAFDPHAFLLEHAAFAFVDDPPGARERLLELVTVVLSADGVIEPAELDYLRKLAAALRVAPPEGLRHLRDLDLASMRTTFTALRAAPPPRVRADLTPPADAPALPAAPGTPRSNGSAPPTH
jgi:uncharacterized tellurite resistance protein B-like protein